MECVGAQERSLLHVFENGSSRSKMPTGKVKPDDKRTLDLDYVMVRSTNLDRAVQEPQTRACTILSGLSSIFQRVRNGFLSMHCLGDVAN
jgi:hypothetical protein